MELDDASVSWDLAGLLLVFVIIYKLRVAEVKSKFLSSNFFPQTGPKRRLIPLYIFIKY